MTFNPINVVKLLSNRVNAKFQQIYESQDSGSDDCEFVNILFNLIKDKAMKVSTVDCIETLALDETKSDNEITNTDDLQYTNSLNESFESSSSSYSYVPESQKKPRRDIADVFKPQLCKKIHDFIVIGKYSKKSALNRWKSLNNDYKLLDQVINLHKGHLNRFNKLKRVRQSMLMEFKKARDSGLSVHYWNLIGWACNAAKDFQLVNFKISKNFINNFKKTNHIVSRKITKFVTKVEIESEDLLKQKAREFNECVEKMRVELNLNRSDIWNADQSKIDYETSSSRTLSLKGEHDTHGKIESSYNLSHSYTIMPLISMSGKLARKLYICLQEKDGKFGPRVAKEVQKDVPFNLYIEASKSGKMEKAHMISFRDNIFKPEIQHKALILLDSWTGQTSSDAIQIESKCVTLASLPPKTTKYCQPLDVYFFRQYKLFDRRITDYLRARNTYYDTSLQLASRKFIMRKHSAIYDQFCSPKFSSMLLYAWKSAGYNIGCHIESFKNVYDICFQSAHGDCCILGCDEYPIIKCSWCSVLLCPNHWIGIDDDTITHVHSNQ